MVSVKVFKALREIASWEKGRIHVRSFRLESTGEIVATDGKIMGIVKREENGSPLKDAVLDRDAIDTILKIAPKDGMIDPDSGSAFGLPLAEVSEGRYPEWRRAVPADAESDERIHLSLGVGILDSLLSACKALGASGVTFKVAPESTVKRAIPFETLSERGAPKMFGVVMPLVVERNPPAVPDEI